MRSYLCLLYYRALAKVNSFAYEVVALRALMIEGGPSVFGFGADFGVHTATLSGAGCYGAGGLPHHSQLIR